MERPDDWEVELTWGALRRSATGFRAAAWLERGTTEYRCYFTSACHEHARATLRATRTRRTRHPGERIITLRKTRHMPTLDHDDMAI